MDVEKKASPQQIIGDGIPITLVDGSVVRLKVSNRAMVKVDELFGSYFEMQSLLTKRAAGPLWATTTRAIWCLLQHEELWRNDVGKVLDSLDPNAALDDYQEAISEAFIQAFPQLAQVMQEEDLLTQMMQQPSPGPTSTPSPDGTSTLATTSSGT